MLRLKEKFTQNPVILKEMRGRMRGGRAFILLTVYLFVLSSLISMIYLAFLPTTTSGTNILTLRQTLGKTLFGTTMLLLLFTACFVAPALTAGSISSEREGQTFDLLRTTLLPARSLVMGKLNSSFLFISLLLFAGLPLLSLATIFGGVTYAEIAIGSIVLIVTTLTFSAVGVFFSSFTKRTLVSTVLAYSFTLMLVFGLPVFLTMGIIFFGVLSSSPSGMSTLTEIMIAAAIYLMIMLNPISAAVVSEIILLNEQTAFFFLLPSPWGSISYPIVSPWLGYTFTYLLLSLVLIWLSIRFVRQAER